MSQAMNQYRANLREFEFLFFEQFQLQNLLGTAPFEEWAPDVVKMVLTEALRFASDVTGPLNRIGDESGCKLVDGRVITPKGFKAAWDRIYEAGWRTLAVPAKWGGQGAPHTLGIMVEEFISGSNTAFAMYPGLALGAAEVIANCGTERQQQLYAKRMMDGRWGGTMCLTEPYAGSDVGASSSRATRNDDGTYNITGTKIYISGGDHDLADNVIHLVLARITGAEAGTKGLSLFVVPRVQTSDEGVLGELNGVEVIGLEHKMGINGSATCVLQFGDSGPCVGELVGTVEHQGMRQMFRMMNFARIGVGIQGVAVASSAYLNALEYARDRKQGASVTEWKNPEAPRAAIIEHPNIRYDLLDMKARVEGIRALAIKLAAHQDRLHAASEDDERADYHKGQVDLLTPLLKAYATDQSFQICERAIQVYGGAGYLKDYPVEQYCRDSKIFSIYEGTNAIQALDLVGRKLGQRGGANTQAFLHDVGSFAAKHAEHPVLSECVKHLEGALQAVSGMAMQYLAWFQAGEMERIPLTAERFLEMMSELAVGWLLQEAAVIACEKLDELGDTDPDRAFYEGKKFAAIHFSQHVLPGVAYRAKVLGRGDRSALEISDAAFGPS